MNKKTVIIIVVVLLCLCCLLTAGGVGVVLVIQHNNQANQPVSPTPVQTNVPTATVTTTVTATPTVSTSPTPTTSGRLTITTLYDEFFDMSNPWMFGKSDTVYSTSNRYIKDGTLHIDSQAKQAFVLGDTLSSQPIINADISVDSHQTSGGTDGDTAIILRSVDSGNYYMFAIDESSQEYSFGVEKNDHWTDIIGWKSSSAISQTAGNTFRVVADGDTFTLYINGGQVDSATNSAITTGGEVGVAIELYHAGDAATFEFDNFYVKVND